MFDDMHFPEIKAAQEDVLLMQMHYHFKVEQADEVPRYGYSTSAYIDLLHGLCQTYTNPLRLDLFLESVANMAVKYKYPDEFLDIVIFYQDELRQNHPEIASQRELIAAGHHTMQQSLDND